MSRRVYCDRSSQLRTSSRDKVASNWGVSIVETHRRVERLEICIIKRIALSTALFPFSAGGGRFDPSLFCIILPLTAPTPISLGLTFPEQIWVNIREYWEFALMQICKMCVHVCVRLWGHCDPFRHSIRVVYFSLFWMHLVSNSVREEKKGTLTLITFRIVMG